MESLFSLIDTVNGVMLSPPVLLALLAVGVLFTLWSGFSQYRSLTHGFGLLSGKWTSKTGPGVLTHFQALSTALSATVGLGNIAGVAIAVQIGGPGAIFWMWMVGLAGMAVKSFEVLASMLYRNVDDPENPHGGTMWAAKRGLAAINPSLAGLGTILGALFCLPLILFALTGGNMFQSWSVSDTTREYFGVAPWITGVILAVVTGLVIIGGIRRIGQIAATLVPFMCAIYITAGLFVIVVNFDQMPRLFGLIFSSAFSPAEASGAFIGASWGMAFIWGMKRALFSSEAGLGSAPIAHSAVKTREPVTEGIVAGLEPFIDTLVVCTITGLVILSSGIWDRDPVAPWDAAPALVQSEAGWAPEIRKLPPMTREAWKAGDPVFVVVQSSEGGERSRITGSVADVTEAGIAIVQWNPQASDQPPRFAEPGVFADYTASTMTAKAFDTAYDGLGKWMVTLAVWLFAISTIISWSYYGEQGIIYLLGERGVGVYRLVYVALTAIACMGIMQTAYEVDALSTIAMGFMLAINLPLIVILAPRTMAAYRDYVARLKTGSINP